MPPLAVGTSCPQAVNAGLHALKNKKIKSAYAIISHLITLLIQRTLSKLHAMICKQKLATTKCIASYRYS